MVDNPTLQVQVVSPERVLYDDVAEMVVCRTTDGEIAFLPGHVPFLGSLGVAKVRAILPGGEERVVAVHGGFVEVSHSRVIVLSDVAELGDQIDVPRATRAAEAARTALASRSDDAEARAALARAQLRLEVAAGRS